MPGPDAALDKFRPMAERFDARLKREFGGRRVRGRGAIKAKRHPMSGILALAADRLFRASAVAPAPGRPVLAQSAMKNRARQG